MPRKKVSKAPAAPKVDAYPKVFDHYGDPRWMLRNAGNQPSCFNGVVDIERYQIRVEKIDEPDEVIEARLKRLWRTTERNHHVWHPMRAYAMRRFGWDHGKACRELDADDQGADYTGGSR